ncbi:MAG: succinate dehydrogenase assembly factor 2 [Cocleimonas sp.]
MNKDESIENSKETLIELSQLRWHCRRGVKELDVVLTNYLEKHYLNSDTDIQQAFKQLLKLEDPILMSLVMDHHQTEDVAQNHVLEKMKNPYSK